MISEAMKNIEMQFNYLTEYFNDTVNTLHENRQSLRDR
jgi:hypothetical protein